MTALLLHTMLSVVLIGWAYMVATHIGVRTAWIWTGTLLVVVIGYLALVARSVFEGSPAGVQAAVGAVAGTLLALAGLACLVLFAAVSHIANRPAAARGAERAVSGWAPRDEESVIVPDSDDETYGSVIDVGTAPSGGSPSDQSLGGRYAAGSADEVEPARTGPARAIYSPTPAVGASATPEYPFAATRPVAPSEWGTTTNPEEDPAPRAPRRALPSPDGPE